MKAFTYGQYIKCIHTLRLNAVMQLAEESTPYNLSKIQTNDFYHQLMQNVLQDKKEATKFINQFIEPRKQITEEELIRYTNRRVNQQHREKEIDLIYRLKDQDLFFVIEHQSTIDNNIPYKMLNCCLDIMQDWHRNRKIKKTTNYPIVVPIVIYTGNQKWKITKQYKERKISDYVFERYQIDFEYNFIDINKISKQILLKQDTIFGYLMFLEKAENSTELIENLQIIAKSTKDKVSFERLIEMISYLLDKVANEKTKQELRKKIERKEGKVNMSTLFERLVLEGKRDILRGKKESQRKIAKNMLNRKLDEKIILEITEIRKEELEKIKKELPTAG